MKVNKDFRKFANGKVGINGMVLDDNLMLAMRKISDETLATSGVRLA